VVLHAAASLLTGPGKGKAKQRFYLWRHTLDGAKTYVNDESTAVSHTVIGGLPLNTYVGFEVAVKDSVGVGEFSQTWTIFVH
jgi:hypothetical protein